LEISFQETLDSSFVKETVKAQRREKQMLSLYINDENSGPTFAQGT
jgi:hypothetical protein